MAVQSVITNTRDFYFLPRINTIKFLPNNITAIKLSIYLSNLRPVSTLFYLEIRQF